MTTTPLITQPSAMPTRKLTWAGLVGVLGIVIVHFMDQLAGLSPFWLGWMDDQTVKATVPLALAWVTGYTVRDHAVPPPPPIEQGAAA